MDPSSTRRFLSTNIEWPAEKLFIPRGGLTNFLCDNLRFKVFLVMMAVFTDAYAFDTVKSLTTGERLAIRFRVRDIVRHMFYAAQIRQNEFRVHYESGVVPSEAAWLFHVILVLLVVVGFEGEEVALVPAPSANVTTEGALAQSQATFFLGAALATFVSHKEDGFDDAQLDFPAYDSARWVSGNIHYRARPSSFHPIPIVDTLADPFDYNLILSRIHEEERRERNRRNAEARPACTHAGHTPMDSLHDCTERPHKSILCPTLPVVHEAEDAADAAVISAALNASFRVIKKMPTRRSYRVLASHLAEGPLVPDEFFVKEEERALSECSSGSMPSLVTPSVTGGSTTV
ncbi:hypothetical protein DFH06DRAFT_1487170 [Mycena polygramma]|nr:hypothetical protein DFH06DRAFT_1487170 [Mycena polygramma]